MTPDDWKQGMANEAASVDDAGWAREARRAARALPLKRQLGLLVGATLASVALALLFMAAINAMNIGYGREFRPVYALLFWHGPLITLVLAFSLTRRGIRPALVSLVPVVSWLLGTLLVAQITLPLAPNVEDVTGIQIDLLPSLPADTPWTVMLPGVLKLVIAVLLGIGLARLQMRRQARA